MSNFVKKFFVHEIITILFVLFFVTNLVRADEFTPPSIYEVTPVYNPSPNWNLYYEFESDEEGVINYSGSCSAAGYSSAYVGTNAIYFDSLPDGYYDDCTISVTDYYSNESNVILVTPFVVDTTPPNLTEVTPVPSPTSDTTPNYTFYTDEAGDFYFASGACYDSSNFYANVGNNTLTFDALPEGTYNDCGIIIYDQAGNESSILYISEFVVQLATPPTLTETYTIYSPNPDITPAYRFTSTEAGTITYGGSCSSATTTAVAGTNTIIFNELANGTYSDCTITVTDGDLDVSDPLTVSSFIIDTNASYFYDLNEDVTSETTASISPYVAVPANEVGVQYGITQSFGQLENQQGDFLVGGFSFELSELTPNTLYYYRPYMITGDGTFYGDIGNFMSNMSPELSQLSPIVSPNPDITPAYRFTSTEAGIITYGGSCSSATTTAVAGTNTIIFNELANGIYSDCTITVTDQYGGASTPLSVSSFTINTAASFFPTSIVSVLSANSAQIDLTGVVPGIEVGVQYGITQSFGQSQSQQGAFVIGNFSFSLTELISDIVYYYRPYLITDEGSIPGTISTFVTIVPVSSWVAQSSAGTKNWWDVVSSSDGQNIAVTTDSNGYIYTSSDAGVTWIERTGSGLRAWRRIAASADGTILVAASYEGYLYRSIDGGASWFPLSGAGSRLWWSVASSSDGQKLAAGVWTGGIYTSSDGGQNWQLRAGPGNGAWYSIASSSDGQKLAAGNWSNGYIYTSSDSGTTWTQRTSAGARKWITIKMSLDGTRIIAAAENGYIYTSSDGGTTWTEQTGAGSRLWGGVASSDDGMVLFATVRNGYVYRSTDGGVTWEQQTDGGSRQWFFLDTNSLGTKTTAAVQGGYIYTNNYTDSNGGTPVITEITPVSSPAIDTTPSYTFTTTQAGTITYEGSCTSETTTATLGVNTITFNQLSPGTYSDCTIAVEDSNVLSVPSFIVLPVTVEAPVVGVVSLPIVIPGLIVQNPIPIPPTSPKPSGEETKITIDTPEKPISIDNKENPTIEIPPSLEIPREDSLLPQSENPSNPPAEQPQLPLGNNASLPDTVINTIQNISSVVLDRIATTLVSGINSLFSLDTTAPALFQSVKTSAVIVGSALAVAPVATNAAGLAPLLDIPRLLAHLWNVLLTALGLRKKRKPWGTVYDSQTKQPLDPAYVTLTNTEGKEVASSLTDIDGRYGFVVPPGTYTLFAKKTNYAFPSKKLQGTFEDELYTSLYFGEQVTITEEGEIINKNIPLDQLAFDWNEFAKNEQHRLTYFKKRDILFGKLSNIFFGAGFIASFIAFLAQTTLLQGAIIVIYIIIYGIRRHSPKMKAKGFISRPDGAPLPFAIIRLISPSTGQEIAHKVSDKTGRYYAIVPNGVYQVTVDEKTPDGSYIKHVLSGTRTITKGYLSEELKV